MGGGARAPQLPPVVVAVAGPVPGLPHPVSVPSGDRDGGGVPADGGQAANPPVLIDTAVTGSAPAIR